MEIRDPIHGAMTLDAAELAVADHAWVQRLRGIRATGFSQVPFPGATHSRYAHSLGVLHLAGLAFDRATAEWTFSSPRKRNVYRALVRMAALTHDVGHGPFSHCIEFAMPDVQALALRSLRRAPLPRRATHEDYTVAILEQTDLGATIDRNFPFSWRHVAAVISPDVRLEDDLLMDGGLDIRPMLGQIVSSELDVDRLDYLVRDAFYTGARYGQVDVPWLMSNLGCWVVDGGLHLALDRAALYAFDHFLLARHHMFLMVYFHHKSVVYEELLKRYMADGSDGWRIPSDLGAYLDVDDTHVLAHLRASKHPFAQRVVRHQPYKRVLERHGTAQATDLSASVAALVSAGLDVIHTASAQRLSRYAAVGRKRRGAPAIWVLPGAAGDRTGPATRLDEASRVFVRYADEHVIARIYVAPEARGEARALLGLGDGPAAP